MWWMFKRDAENEHELQYAYSRENHTLDGTIRYDKSNGEITVLKRCAADNSTWDDEQAMNKFAFVINEGFPEERMVACG